jgi:hypothetical protein
MELFRSMIYIYGIWVCVHVHVYMILVSKLRSDIWYMIYSQGK